MKVATFGLDIQPGKYKYSPEFFTKLVKKFSAKKETPYSVEFVGEEFEKADAVVFAREKRFDFVFLDIEKIERRLQRSDDSAERALLERLNALLEKEQLLCDADVSPQEDELLKNLALITYRPSLEIETAGDPVELIPAILKRAGVILFYTVAKNEVRAWELARGSDIVHAAGKVHSDLARGFIKADVVNIDQLDNFYNMAEARARGFVKTVGREYVVEDGDIIEIKFSV